MFAINPTEDGLRLTWNEQLILEYHFQMGGPRTYWHPLRLPDSPVLTMDRPEDHIHHQGLWVAWKKVNGVNFWEQPRAGVDPSGFGRIVHKELHETYSDVKTARIVTENQWIDWRDVTHLSEVRQTELSAPQKNYLIMDIALQFRPAGGSVTLDLNRGIPGRGGLFYSGLTARFENAMTPGQLLDADGRTEAADIFGSRSRWCGFAGKHQEDGRVYGITILDHPDNPRYPTAWWVRNAENYALVQPGLCYHEPFKLAVDDVLQLKYRLVLHKGYVDPSLIENILI